MSRGLSSKLARARIRDWVRIERTTYADGKYAAANHDQIHKAIAELNYAETLDGFLATYITRAKVLGLDTPAGRQALGKAATTLLDFLEHAVVAHGDMPKPGLASGEIQEWAP